MRPSLAPHVNPAQAILVQEIAEHRFDGALADAAYLLALPAALPVLGAISSGDPGSSGA